MKKNIKKSSPQSTIKVELKFTYEFTSKEWGEHEAHMEEMEKDINQKLEFDAESCYHHLNNITMPTNSYTVKMVSTK